MTLDAGTFAHLERLERELLAPATRNNAGRLRELLSDQFEEVGASGRCFGRESVIEELRREDPAEAASLSMEGCRGRTLAEGVVLLRYRSSRTCGDGVRVAERCTVWQLGAKGWQATFHQGTVVP